MIGTGKRRGEGVAGSKLTEKTVLEIRARYVPHSHIHGLSALGRRYNVDQSTIRSAVRGLTWQHVKGVSDDV